MSLDMNNWVLRIAAVYEEAFAALSTPVPVDVFPYFYQSSEGFPFLTLQLGAFALPNWDAIQNSGQEYDDYVITVNAYLYAGKVSQGYRGELDTSIRQWIPHIVQYFNERDLIQSAAFPTRPDDLTDARITACSGIGLIPYATAGEGVLAVGTTFTHTLTANIELLFPYT